jgi:hypothetical protein
MPACGMEGRGGVVVKRLAVMVRTGRRSARVSHTKWLSTNEVKKADDGGSVPLVRFTVSNDKFARTE